MVATLQGKEPGSCSIGLRADMDALPILEETGLPYQVRGVLPWAVQHEPRAASPVATLSRLAR